jgi:RNA polymerase sigma-70 factor (ECF subfamily)
MDTADARPQSSAVSLLTVALSGGDEEAFREFHQRYCDRLFRYQLVVARGNEDAAREALQETFLRVVRHVRRFDDEETFWSWLTVLARSAAADRGRKQQRYWRALANYARSLFDSAPAAPDANSDSHLEKLLDESLAELAPEERSLIEAKYFTRTSVRELSAQTGLTEKAVESRLVRARRQLRETILEKLRHENAA